MARPAIELADRPFTPLLLSDTLCFCPVGHIIIFMEPVCVCVSASKRGHTLFNVMLNLAAGNVQHVH